MKRRLSVLRRSPFFEVFATADLEALARHGTFQTCEPGEVILEEGAPASTFFLLDAGEVQLAFDRPPAATASTPDEQGPVIIQRISDRGRPLGWSSMVDPFQYRASATAVRRTRLLALDRGFLEHYCEAHPAFGVTFMKRLLWVLGNRLRATRIQLVAQRFHAETVAIRALLDQAAEVLSVSSPLHKIAHYLETRLTLSDAFHVLEDLQVNGEEQERTLAGLCLEILRNVRTEMLIYQDLQRIYELVADAPEDEAPAEIRRKCSLMFIHLFGRTDFVVKGEHHLPARPGHIFIMNHLANHPENTLPNEFQLTLDTHFVSSVILFQRYGQAPVRVIRTSYSAEHGHKRYYDRLGYIYVKAGQFDDLTGEPPGEEIERRLRFLEAGRAVLESGTNLVICPEGRSTTTDLSPVAFRPGAFRLAAYVHPEPLIVPIAVANFDRKITRTRIAAVIHPPFRVSAYVANPASDDELYAFMADLRERFRGYVREAQDLAASW